MKIICNIVFSKNNLKLLRIREVIKLKDKIIDILMEELCEVNCDSCDAEYCEDCKRKEQNWGIGYHKAEKIADRILN